MRQPIQNEKGIALIIALMIMLMLVIIGLGIVKSSNDEVSIAGNELNEMRAFYAAESGLEQGTAYIQHYYESTGIPPTSFPAETLNLAGVTYGYSTVPETPVTKTITKTALAGMEAFSRPYHINSTAVDSSHSTAVTVQHHFEVVFVPIYQFGIFYNEDLEIAPGTNFGPLGRIHSNHNIYVQSGSPLRIESYVTAHGNIYHGPKTGSGLTESSGDVLIKGSDNNYHSMKEGADWLDANSSHWYDSAASRWGGHVQDASFGLELLSLPFESSTSGPHKLIERYDATGNPNSLENKASLKIIDGQAYYDIGGGTWTNVTAPLTVAGFLTETTFYDKREGQNVTVVDVKVDSLKTTAYLPSNGIIYFADSRSGLHGLRLTDARDIGLPMTVASLNPVYTVGNINDVNKKPMSIIADAVTVLSGNWSDNPALAASSTVSDRPALTTQVNFSVCAGHIATATGTGTYSGGAENLIRLLEDWSGQTLTFQGSLASMWQSQMATAPWSNSYYVPPNRNYSFDPDLYDVSNMPPGTPTVRAFIRWGWRQENVGYVPREFAAYLNLEATP